MAQTIDLVINLAIFFNIGIATGNICLWLIIVKIADKIVNFIIGEKRLEFTVQLCRQRLVMREYECRHIPISDDIRHRKSLTRPRHTKKRLLSLAGVKPSN